MRIFTGAPVPAAPTAWSFRKIRWRTASLVTVIRAARAGQNMRGRGLDFKKGETLLSPGIRINARDIGLAAAMNCAKLRVRRKPRGGGDRHRRRTGAAGHPPAPRPDRLLQQPRAHRHGRAFRRRGSSILASCRDRLKATERAIARAAAADILVTSGGASVGDHDFVQEALKSSGVKIDFWKIAMRPGKPFMYGRRGPPAGVGSSRQSGFGAGLRQAVSQAPARRPPRACRADGTGDGAPGRCHEGQ